MSIIDTTETEKFESALLQLDYSQLIELLDSLEEEIRRRKYEKDYEEEI